MSSDRAQQDINPPRATVETVEHLGTTAEGDDGLWRVTIREGARTETLLGWTFRRDRRSPDQVAGRLTSLIAGARRDIAAIDQLLAVREPVGQGGATRAVVVRFADD